MFVPMHAFSARTAGARSSFAAIWLVRVATYGVPTLASVRQGQAFALGLALFLGALDGWFRLRVARTARSLIAEADAMVISSGLDIARIAWPNVLAIEVWHRLNRVDYVAVHYRATGGNSVSTCWEQGNRDGLLELVRRCGALVQAVGPRTTIALAHLGDRAVRLALLRRLSHDLALALLVGTLCGITNHAIWLGAAAGFVSTLMTAAPYLNRAELVMRDGVWWQRAKNGELVSLRVIPRSLRLWVGSLSETARPSIHG
jgi:hypothetical protein